MIISATFVIIYWKLLIPFNFLTDLVNAYKAGISNANTRGAAQQQANCGRMSHFSLWFRWATVIGICPNGGLNHIWIMNTHKSKAPEEVLYGGFVKQVIVDAVLGLVMQPPLLGDEVPDRPGSKLLVESVLHVVHQNLNL